MSRTAVLRPAGERYDAYMRGQYAVYDYYYQNKYHRLTHHANNECALSKHVL